MHGLAWVLVRMAGEAARATATYPLQHREAFAKSCDGAVSSVGAHNGAVPRGLGPQRRPAHESRVPVRGQLPLESVVAVVVHRQSRGWKILALLLVVTPVNDPDKVCQGQLGQSAVGPIECLVVSRSPMGVPWHRRARTPHADEAARGGWEVSGRRCAGRVVGGSTQQ